jgi:hypothetical protein
MLKANRTTKGIIFPHERTINNFLFSIELITSVTEDYVTQKDKSGEQQKAIHFLVIENYSQSERLRNTDLKTSKQLR